MKTYLQFIAEGGWVEDTEGPETAVDTKVKRSHMGVLRAYSRWEKQGDRHESKTVSVHPSKLRATQGWVDSKYEHGKHENPKRPYGLQDKRGNVHIIDGHHRANHAVEHGHHLEMDVRPLRG